MATRQQEEIGRDCSEAKRLRAVATDLRIKLKAEKSKPLLYRDRMAMMRIENSITENVRRAQEHEEHAAKVRLECGFANRVAA